MNPRPSIVPAAALLALAAAPAALAHPGHAPLEHGAAHWFAGHGPLVALALAGLAAVAASGLARRPALRRAVAATGSCLVVAALAAAHGRA